MPSMRNKLITYLRVSDEEQIKALYTLLEKDIQQNTLFINDDCRDLIADLMLLKKEGLDFFYKKRSIEEME